MGGDRMGKRLSLGTLMRKKLSDITNNPLSSQPFTDEFQTTRPEQEEQYIPKCHSDCIVQQLLKERVTLLQVIAQRNKVIESAGTEVQKLKLQNRHLAQSNTHMLAELNLGREKVKALQHEVACKAALFKAKDLQSQGKVNMKPDLQTRGDQKVVQPQSLPKADNDEIASHKNRRHTRRSQSLGASVPSKKDVIKENTENRRRSLRIQSAMLKSDCEKKSGEDLFELEDVRLQVTQLDKPVEEGNSSQIRSTATVDKNENDAAYTYEIPRVSFGRPLRKSVEKIQTFKEPSLRCKMRRVE